MSTSGTLFRFLVGLFISLLIIFLDGLNWLNWLRGGIETITGPQTRLFRQIGRSVNRAAETIRFVKSGPVRIADLERRLADSQSQVEDNRNLDQENRAMKQILNTITIQSLSYSPVKILSAGQKLTINNIGLRPGQAVISPDGILVGIVNQVGRWSAGVLRLTDSGSQIEIKITDSSGNKLSGGSLVGAYGGSAVIKKILTEIELEPGLSVLSSGSDDRVPPGLLIGWTTGQITREESSLYQQVVITPAADLSQLENLLVITANE